MQGAEEGRRHFNRISAGRARYLQDDQDDTDRLADVLEGD